MQDMARIYVWLLAIFISIGGFFWGYDPGTINGVKEMRGFRMTFDILFNQDSDEDLDSMLNQTDVDSDGMQCGSKDDVDTSALLGMIVSIFSIGALVGALVSGLLSDLAGRKLAVIIGATTCFIGGSLQVSSFYLWMLLPGRIISGIGTGILLQACSLYVAEVAPKERRGAMVSLSVTFTLVASVMSTVTNSITERYLYGWRFSLSLQVLVSAILALGTLFVPETPRFLLKKHKDARALEVLMKIYKREARARDEFDSIKESLMQSTSSNKKNCSQSLKYFRDFSIIQQVFIGFVLMLLARTAGPPVIIYYSVAIFCKLGANGFVASIVLVILMLLTQVTGIFLVDKCGRKFLLLLGAVILGLSLISAAALVQIFDLESEASLSVGRQVAGYFVIGFICLMMCANNISYGSVVWVVLNEIYPLRIRGVGTALGQLGWWGGTFLMGEVGPVLLSSPLKTAGTFYLLSGMCIVAFLHVLLLLPETKGRSLEDIEVLFTTESWLKRTDLLYYLRCGCFCCLSRTRRRRMMQVQISETADSEEREQLQEPLDQISLSSGDSIEPDDENVSTL